MMPRTNPTQPDLIDHRAIKPLEDVAVAYADIRDRRMALNREEADLKEKALALMHKHGKTVYRRDGVEITIEPTDEVLKVRVKKTPEAADEADQE
jgi:hypothetical protein